MFCILPCDALCCLRILPAIKGSLDAASQYCTRAVSQNKPLFFVTYPVCCIVLLAKENELDIKIDRFSK
jgi:hypothetical protein